MKHKIVAPEVGESITEVSILKWNKQDGDHVDNGEMILEIESDKATVEVIAEASGQLNILKQEGETIPVGELVAEVDDSLEGKKSSAAPAAEAPKAAPAASAPAPVSAAPASPGTNGQALSPSVRKAALEGNVDVSRLQGTGKGGRITTADVQTASSGGGMTTSVQPAPMQAPRPMVSDTAGVKRVKMSLLRKRIAERLLQAQQNAAILTTFNEVDMKPVMDLRKQYKDPFKAKHGTPLSFMSFFTRASVEALRMYPSVNAYIENEDILYHDNAHIGIAVGTDRGLVVPVLRNANAMDFLEIEQGIGAMAAKARSGKLSIADMTGGTFTISNGGVYGSMLSTPILNPPQTGILGMHNIMQRPMAIDGKVEIRPMMYLAMSYDHRLIDGKEAVSFLIAVKDHMENPDKLGLDFLKSL